MEDDVDMGGTSYEKTFIATTTTTKKFLQTQTRREKDGKCGVVWCSVMCCVVAGGWVGDLSG